MSNPLLQLNADPEKAGRVTPIESTDCPKPRYSVSGVTVRLGTFDRAHVVNIGLGGVAIETQKYLQVGKSYPMRFRSDLGPLRLTGTVVWSQLTRTVTLEGGEVAPVYRAGFEFAVMSSAQTVELEEFIAELLESVDNGKLPGPKIA